MNWIPPNKSAGVPWAREVADITHGAPKTGRVPTGGWRSYGAVPSHTYAQDDGYWSGLGQIGGSFGADATSPTTATSTTPTSGQIFANVVGQLGTAAASIYSSYTQQQIASQVIRRGGTPAPPPPTTLAPALHAAPATTAPAPKSNMPLILGGLGIGAVALMVMMKKR